MLSLSLPRGFGLMFILAPCYKAPKKRIFGKMKPRPKLAVPPIDGDLLKDAHALLDAGNLLAAAMMCRVIVERDLTKLALNYPSFGEYWQGINTTAEWLFARRFLRSNTFKSVTEAANVGNRAAHGQPVTREEVMRMFGAVESLRHTVRRNCGRKAVNA